MSQEYKRAAPRVSADFEVKFETIDQFAMAYCTELSTGGMFLATEDPQSVGSPVRVRLVLPETNTEVLIQARVAHARTLEDASVTGRPAGMGVQFVDLDPALNAQLEQFIAERMAAQDDKATLPPPRRGISVLVVEDDPGYQKLVASSFSNPEDTVRIANNGFEALAMCAQQHPDVIVSDVNMPKMDGWQLLRLLRSKSQFASVPVLFTTKLGSESDRLRGYQLGVDDYIAKPFRAVEVRTRVERLLTRSGANPVSVGPVARAAPSKGGHSLRGDLAHVSLPSVLSFMEMEQRTGRLSVHSDKPGTVVLRAGWPVVATVGDPVVLRARDALFTMLSWRSGDFNFEVCEVADEDTIGMPLSHLLLEHARISDEGGR